LPGEGLFLKYIQAILKRLPIKDTGSLQTKLFIFFFAVMVLMAFLISTASYYVFKGLISREIGRSRVDVLRQIGERTRVIKSSITTVSNLYYGDERVYHVVSRRAIDEDSQRLLVKSLKAIASKYQKAFEQINVTYYAVVIGENGFGFCSTANGEGYNYRKIPKMLWYRNVIKTDGKIFWVSSYDDSDNAKESRYVFSAARIIKDKQTGERLGVLLINIEERKLFETYGNVLNGKNSISIVDDRGSFVSHSDEHMLGINFYDMKRFREIFEPNSFRIIKKGNDPILLSNYVDPETGWTIVEEIPVGELLAPLNKVKYTILGIFCFCTLLSFILSFSFANKTAKPLKQFCLSMEKVQKGDLDVISDIKGWDELQQLSDGFNQMVQKIKELIRDVKLEERLKRKAELDFLQAQINPHFLYNTLFSIKCLISMGKTFQAEQMLAAFMVLLERVFNRKDEFITLAEEIECLRQYVLIQQYRYSHKFEVSYDLPPAVLDYRVPKLILQPLVENSIFHGIEAKQEPGRIVISAERKRDELFIRVIDDGAGMDDAALKAIWNNQNGKQEKRFNGVGIMNVQQRIQMNFGIQYGLKIFSKLGKGTKIQINLPVID
jgi:two-component system sensor histidine kinase YesM